MMALLIILSVLLVLLTFLLVTPILLEVDTDSSRPLVLIWRGVLRFSLVLEEGRFFGEIRILGFRKEIQFKMPKKKEKKKRKNKFNPHKALHVLRSFKLRKMDWELDTGNYVLNAQLYAVTWLVERPNVHVQLNFWGRNRLRLVVENRLISLIRAFLKK